jgi:hypothetical protein
MPDLSSVPSAERKNTGKTGAAWINPNAVLQKILHSLHTDERNKIVLRCDELPLVTGREEDFENLFRSLLQMILQKKGEVATLYLHISCTREEPVHANRFGSRYFTIQFNSNIVPCNHWFENNKDRLNAMEALVAENKGTLVTNAFRAGGCIFSVSLPGKAV